MPRKSLALKPITNSESADLHRRLMRALPVASFELETFTRLTVIVATRNIPTAAVECTNTPRLLINPDFVAKYCKRDEHLFLLVMHELWHIVLAHTNLYPRITKAHNIAFDAIINAGLSRQFPEPIYQGFFDAVNPHDTFPHLLLRPPINWQTNPEYPTDIGPKGTERILRQLYPPPDEKSDKLPLYQEILDLIKKNMEERGELVQGTPQLLGDHDNTRSMKTKKNKFLKDTLKRTVHKWPRQPMELGPPGRGGVITDFQVDREEASRPARVMFSRILKKTLVQSQSNNSRKQKQNIATLGINGVLPNARDRLMPAKKAIGAPTTLWTQSNEQRVRLPRNNQRSHVYIDVSGSISRVLPHLLNILVPFVSDGYASAFQFSTHTLPLSARQLRALQVTSSGGTDIRCVMAHLLEQPRPVQKVIILTDGYVGLPTEEQHHEIQKKNIKITVILPNSSPYQDDLQGIASNIYVLPPLHGNDT